MIAFVSGTVAGLTPTSAVVEVGGIGIDVQCTPGTLAELRLGKPATLPTSMVVREDSLTLFGFANDDEKQMFELVQTASGVGPKVAQAMLAVLDPASIQRAISTEDARTLTSVPGIGQKGAQRIILELKDRIGPAMAIAESTRRPDAALDWESQVQTGLVGLGWSAREASKAVESVRPEADKLDRPDVAQLLRLALRSLSKA